MRRDPRVAVSALAALFLSACQMSATLHPGATVRPAAGDGVIVLMLTNPDVDQWVMSDRIEVQSTRDGSAFALSALDANLFSTRVFVGQLPPGAYSLKDDVLLTSRKFPENSRITSPLGELGSFTIQPGRVTDLGTLLLVPLEKEFKDGKRSFVAGARRQPSDTSALLRDRYPAIDADQRGKEAIDWDDTPDHRRAAEIYERARLRLAATRQADIAASGTLWFTGRLGQVAGFKEDGARRRLAAETGFEFFAVHELPDHRVLAGGEGGYLWLWSGEGAKADPIRLGHFDERVIALGEHPRIGLYAATYDQDTLRFYRSREVAGPWQSFGSFKQASGPINSVSFTFTSVHEGPKGLVANVRPDVLVSYDAEKGQWLSHKAPFELSSYAILPDGAVVAREHVEDSADRRASYYRLRITRDGGQSWGPAGEFRGRRWVREAPVILDASRWIVCATEDDFMRRASVAHFVETTDAGRSWHEVSTLEVSLLSPLRIHVGPGFWTMDDGTGAGLLYSKDAARTWAPLFKDSSFRWFEGREAR